MKILKHTPKNRGYEQESYIFTEKLNLLKYHVWL